MAGKYRAVGWNRQKKLYDAALLGGLALTVGAYAGVSAATNPGLTAETLLIRGTSLAAFLLLHVILCIGPLARLDARFLPLLYNRRHLGVTMFLLALAHAGLAAFQFHALGTVNPLTSVVTAYARDYRLAAPQHFPFEPFGVFALGVLFAMAATSHDFWLRLLGASFWKTLHLGVYAAYGAVVVHVALGALQYERSPVYVALLGGGFALVCGLHLTAAWREARRDGPGAAPETDGFVAACRADTLREGCGKAVAVAGERRAVFLHRGRVYALSNMCRHQGGPIAEGRILDGCITCPWHGWQYRPDSGTSPPPFHEVLDTYPVRVHAGTVYVHPLPHAAGAHGAGAPL